MEGQGDSYWREEEESPGLWPGEWRGGMDLSNEDWETGGD